MDARIVESGRDIPLYHHDITAGEVYCLLGKTDPVILELGCNDSETTRGFLMAMPNAKVIAFEPDPRPLARHVCRNDPRVTLFECAISDRDGTAPFTQSGGQVKGSTAPCSEDWDYSGSLRVPTGHLDRDKQVKFPSTIIVQTRRLDGIPPVAALPFVDLIFADLQGSEAAMILGGQETLRKTRWLYLEYYDVEQYDRQADLKGLLSFLLDWDLTAKYADNALLKNRLL